MIELLAPAKLTWFLEVTGRRGDGFHELRAEMLTLDFADRLEVDESGDVLRVVAETLAAIRLLAAHLALDEHTPGAVEDGDPLAEDCFDSLARVLHCLLLPSSPPGSANGALGLFRRLLTRSPSCLSKLSGNRKASSTAHASLPAE